MIWVGMDDNGPMPFTGSSGALPIWQESFRRMGTEPLTPSRSLVDIPVNPQGQLLEDGCSGKVYNFPASWQTTKRLACESGVQSIGKGIRSWFERLF